MSASTAPPVGSRQSPSRLPSRQRRRRSTLVLPLLATGLAVAIVAALSIGAFPVMPSDIWTAVTAGVTGNEQTTIAASVVWDVRIPRVLLAVLVGATLAAAGTLMQGSFANPLAEPGIVGVSSGAAVAAVLSIVAGLTAFGAWVLPGAAFVGGIAVTAAVYWLARVDGRTEVLTLVLVGIAVNAFAGALIGLLMSVSNDAQLRSITFWNLGSLSGATWVNVLAVLPIAVVGIGLSMLLVHKLDMLALGERAAGHLGVNVESLRRWVIFLVAALTAAAVAVAGIIVFVGLVVPHAVRLLVGPTHRRLLPAAVIAGALLLVVADLIARTIVAPREIPIGVLTALVGSPVFFWLLRREHKRRGSWA